MTRIFIGSILGGLLQFVIGAVAWVSPLGLLAFRAIGDQTSADLQLALARTLGPIGTGTYFIPNAETSAGTQMMGRGPVALVFFNSGGFPLFSTRAILTGLVLSIVMMMLVGVALSLVETTANRIKVAGLFTAAFALYFVLSLPVFNFYLPWAWWIFLAVEELIAFAAGAYVLIRWFMPKVVSAAPGTLH